MADHDACLVQHEMVAFFRQAFVNGQDASVLEIACSGLEAGIVAAQSWSARADSEVPLGDPRLHSFKYIESISWALFLVEAVGQHDQVLLAAVVKRVVLVHEQRVAGHMNAVCKVTGTYRIKATRDYRVFVVLAADVHFVQGRDPADFCVLLVRRRNLESIFKCIRGCVEETCELDFDAVHVGQQTHGL